MKKSHRKSHVKSKNKKKYDGRQNNNTLQMYNDLILCEQNNSMFPNFLKYFSKNDDSYSKNQQISSGTFNNIYKIDKNIIRVCDNENTIKHKDTNVIGFLNCSKDAILTNIIHKIFLVEIGNNSPFVKIDDFSYTVYYNDIYIPIFKMKFVQYTLQLYIYQFKQRYDNSNNKNEILESFRENMVNFVNDFLNVLLLLYNKFNFIHGDLSPTNIMCEFDEKTLKYKKFYIIDLGLSRFEYKGNIFETLYSKGNTTYNKFKDIYMFFSFAFCTNNMFYDIITEIGIEKNINFEALKKAKQKVVEKREMSAIHTIQFEEPIWFV